MQAFRTRPAASACFRPAGSLALSAPSPVVRRSVAFAPLPQQPRVAGNHVAAAAAGDAPAVPEAMTGIEKFADKLATLFPLWVFLGAFLGITRPEAVTWFSSTLFTYALGFLMLAMGLTLTIADFKECAKRPGPILVGYLAQASPFPFPLSAW